MKILTQIIPKDATVWMGHGAHFVTYYLRGGELINFVAVREEQAWTEEAWQIPADIDNLRQAFANWPESVTAVLKQCSECQKWGLFDHQPLPSWHKGRLVLLGDACHPMLPFMAQGAAMALEDAKALAVSVSNNNDLSDAFSTYQAARKARTSRVQAISKSNASIYHASGAFTKSWRRAKFILANALPPLANMQFDWLYNYNQTEG